MDACSWALGPCSTRAAPDSVMAFLVRGPIDEHVSQRYSGAPDHRRFIGGDLPCLSAPAAWRLYRRRYLLRYLRLSYPEFFADRHQPPAFLHRGILPAPHPPAVPGTRRGPRILH